MSLNETIFKNYVHRKIKECIEESKEKTKIPFIDKCKIQEVKKVVANMNYCEVNVHWREYHKDYVLVIYDI